MNNLMILESKCLFLWIYKELGLLLLYKIRCNQFQKLYNFRHTMSPRNHGAHTGEIHKGVQQNRRPDRVRPLISPGQGKTGRQVL